MKLALPFIGLVASLCAVSGWASQPLIERAPEFPTDSLWVNSMPFALSQLSGRRVVLLAFINAANINSLRALKALEAWDEAWSLKGLMIIAVHAPAFDFQKDSVATRDVLRYYGAQFPIVLDNDGLISKAYVNQGWPSFFLIDGQGGIVYNHLGEDRYGEIEAEIRKSLAALPGYGRPDDPPLVKDVVLSDCGKATAEISLSTDVVRPVGKAPSARRILFGEREGKVERAGQWTMSVDGLRLAQSNKSLKASLRIVYRGSQAFAVLTPGAAKSARFFIKQDGLWLHSLNAGADARFDRDGRSYVSVDLPRLYELAVNASDEPHELELLPVSRGSGIHQFSFSDRCLPLAR